MLPRILSPVFRHARFTQNVRNSSCQGGDMKKLMDLKCKVALITGGQSGIGAATAGHLLSRGVKAVVITGLDECEGEAAVEKLNSLYGHGRSCFIKVDVCNQKMIEDAIKETLARFTSLDILFNNAGVLNDKEWEKTIDINLTGVIRGTLLGLEYMPSSESKSNGIIINNASTFAFDRFPPAPIYVSTKHAIRGFTKTIGHSSSSSKGKIRVVALCPGVTETAMTEKVMPQLTPDLTAKTISGLKALPGQSADATSRAVAYLAEYAESGTLWPVEANILYRAHEPDRKTYQNKVVDV